jgi:hypothetical protein
MNGYHVYYKNSEPKDYHEIDLLVNIASCLFWKKYYGKIILYCNQEHLEYIQQYGVDQFYDEINTTFLETIPHKDLLDRYWSFCKIYVANYVADFDENFAIFDTDFYFRGPYDFDTSLNFVGYHKEAYNPHNPHNPYPTPSLFLNPENLERLDWDTDPVNCAFMYLNSKSLVKTWYIWAEGVIKTKRDSIDSSNINTSTIFIEQRLLPTLANSMGLKQDTLLPNYYLTYIPLNDDLHEWFPMIDSHPKYRERFNRFRHTWGLKRYYYEEKWRKLISTLTLEDLESFNFLNDLNQQTPHLISLCKSI